MSDVEQRMSLVPLEELLAERDELVSSVAPLRAKYGPNGTWDALRTIQLATIAQRIRAQAVLDGEHMTQAEVKDAAHADPDYAAAVATATDERATWALLEAQIEGIDFTVNRGQAIARFLSAEARLAD